MKKVNTSVFKLTMLNKWQKFIHSDVRQSTTKKILATIFAIFAAFIIAFIIACSVCGTWGDAGKVFATFFTSGFQSKYVNTLFSNMCILIVGGLAFIFAYKAGLFNIGISGQMVAGATGATLICHLAGLGSGANQFVILLVSMALGAFMAALVGAMKAFLRVNEVVSSIMFNWIIYFMSILILGSISAIPHDSSNLNTNAPANDILLRLNGESFVPLIIITIILIGLVAVILNYTVFGRKQRVTGLSTTGALASGYNVKANMIASMAISGAIAGVLGVMVYCGFSPNMPVTAAAKAIPQEGFNGISVGLISMCSPVATVPVSLFFSMVKTSVSDLQMIGIDNHISDVVFGIVVYGAAAISLFLNLKPYWLTLDIFRGKNYSKIKHERNMSNIELISISSDQCAILRKYFIYYQKQQTVQSTMKLPHTVKIKMWWADVRYWLVKKEAKWNIRRNKTTDIFTGKKFYRQEMVHLYKNKSLLAIDTKRTRRGGWYIKVSDKVLANKDFETKVREGTGMTCTPELKAGLMKANEEFKAHPFTDHEIRLLPKLAYLQNLRTGLSYRVEIARQNKLTYFTLEQTKQQAESIGLAEIRSKAQYDFAHSAYLKAYWRTYDVVKAHYDTMVKTFGRGKQLNIFGIRFDSATLNNLFMNNLKEEIAAIAHLINCPLTKAQLNEVGSLITEVRNLEDKMDNDEATAKAYRQIAKNYNDKAKHAQDDMTIAKYDIAQANARIASIVARARDNEKALQHEKWMAQEAANEQAERELKEFEEKKARKQAKLIRREMQRKQKEAIRDSRKGL